MMLEGRAKNYSLIALGECYRVHASDDALSPDEAAHVHVHVPSAEIVIAHDRSIFLFRCIKLPLTLRMNLYNLSKLSSKSIIRRENQKFKFVGLSFFATFSFALLLSFSLSCIDWKKILPRVTILLSCNKKKMFYYIQNCTFLF